jgi:hypothetical protein
MPLLVYHEHGPVNKVAPGAPPAVRPKSYSRPTEARLIRGLTPGTLLPEHLEAVHERENP